MVVGVEILDDGMGWVKIRFRKKECDEVSARALEVAKVKKYYTILCWELVMVDNVEK